MSTRAVALWKGFRLPGAACRYNGKGVCDPAGTPGARSVVERPTLMLDTDSFGKLTIVNPTARKSSWARAPGEPFRRG